MSLIATFYLVADAKRAALLEASRPVEVRTRERILGIIPRTRTVTRYPLWDWLAANAEREEDLPLSGMALADLVLVDGAASGPDFLSRPDELGSAMGKNLDATFATYDAGQARAAMARLDAIDLSEERVLPILREEDPAADAARVEGLAAARDWLRAALALVTPGTLGVLHIG